MLGGFGISATIWRAASACWDLGERVALWRFRKLDALDLAGIKNRVEFQELAFLGRRSWLPSSCRFGLAFEILCPGSKLHDWGRLLALLHIAAQFLGLDEGQKVGALKLQRWRARRC